MSDAHITPPEFDMPPKPCCQNCGGLYDDGDGPEYGPPYMRCRIKPHMENLRGFPFSTPQKCFETHCALLVDWEKEFTDA